MEDRMVTEDDFRIQFAHAAGTFQVLEECLKIYLQTCFNIVRSRLPPDMCFDYTVKDVVNEPMGRLAQMFKRYNSDAALYGKLMALTKKRNYIAHQAYLIMLDKTYGEDVLIKEITKVNDISNEASAVAKLVSRETRKLHKLYEKLKRGS
jgi:hypothetical protein